MLTPPLTSIALALTLISLALPVADAAQYAVFPGAPVECNFATNSGDSFDSTDRNLRNAAAVYVGLTVDGATKLGACRQVIQAVLTGNGWKTLPATFEVIKLNRNGTALEVQECSDP
ncbi:hypothetical protein HK104_010379 [Borealophlyctis nickersoniae]|nr:hypothetical protein HK104_010379 [Borealophlyctis nickersoniae]